MLTQKQVKELFDYDPVTGHLIWKVNTSVKKFIGKIAGALHSNGYIDVQVYGKKYKAHRLVWVWHNSDFTKNEIDHINGVRDDNRIENLREATKSENQQNQKRPRKTNKSGYLGVSALNNGWIAQIIDPNKKIIDPNKKRLYLGYFDTPEKAYKAYLLKKRELHPFGTL